MRFCTALAALAAGGLTLAAPTAAPANPPLGVHVDVGPLHLSYGSGHGWYGRSAYLYTPYLSGADCYRDNVYLYRARPHLDYFWGHTHHPAHRHDLHRHDLHHHDLHRHGPGRYDSFGSYPYRRR